MKTYFSKLKSITPKYILSSEASSWYFHMCVYLSVCVRVCVFVFVQMCILIMIVCSMLSCAFLELSKLNVLIVRYYNVFIVSKDTV